MPSYRVGCDIGGTFTDIVVIDQTGEVWISKAQTTPDELFQGVKNAIESVANKVGIDPTSLLSQTDRFINGTTIVTNNIIEQNGAKTGLLTTKGFEDTLRIARSPHGPERDQQEQKNVPDFVERDCIKDISERIDYKGEELVELDEEHLRNVTTELVEDKHVETIAICFLWSFQNPTHELRAREIIDNLYPDLYVTLSHEVYPKIREYERMVTSVLNSYAAPDEAKYLEELQEGLSEMGLDTGNISIMHSAGGGMTPGGAKRKPIRLIDSGPVAGVIGVQKLGDSLELENIIAADMGGTSFECSIIEEGEYKLSERTEIKRQVTTGLTKIDTNTIGAGGGSVVHVDERGIPQVGPQSVGADPGPACYGLGGTQPTLTDAALILGIMNPDSFRGGEFSLDIDSAKSVFSNKVAEPLGFTLEEAAGAAYEIAITTMSNAVRNVTIEKGLNPDKFTLCSYGGALPMFVADVCEILDIDDILLPVSSPVFSAYGMVQADDVRSLSRSHFWNPGDPVEPINNQLEEMEDQGREELQKAGYGDDSITVQREARFKFEGQLFDHPVSLPDGKLSSGDLDQIRDEFPRIYEEEYGPGSAWDTNVIIRLLSVTCRGKTEEREPKRQSVEAVSAEPTRSREVYLPMEHQFEEVEIFEANQLSPGFEINGPGIVEKSNTTIYIPRSFELEVDGLGNCRMYNLEEEVRTTSPNQELRGRKS